MPRAKTESESTRCSVKQGGPQGRLLRKNFTSKKWETERSFLRKIEKTGADTGQKLISLFVGSFRGPRKKTHPPNQDELKENEKRDVVSFVKFGLSEHSPLADELSRVSDKLKGSKPPEMAKVEAVVGYYSLGDPLDTLVAERDHLYSLPLTRKGAWARFLRKISVSSSVQF